MKIHRLIFRRNPQKYDWVFAYLQSHISLKPSQFLWSRLRAYLQSLPQDYGMSSAPHFMVEGMWKWAFPFIFLITISLGAYIGFKFADNLKHYNEPEYIYQLEPISPELEMPIDM